VVAKFNFAGNCVPKYNLGTRRVGYNLGTRRVGYNLGTRRVGCNLGTRGTGALGALVVLETLAAGPMLSGGVARWGHPAYRGTCGSPQHWGGVLLLEMRVRV